MIDDNLLGIKDVKGKCPECKEFTIFLAGYTDSCEDCGEHSAVRCEECGETFEHVWGYDKILDYNNNALS